MLFRSVAVELEDVVRRLVARGWPWRMHAVHDEIIDMALDVFERIGSDMTLRALPWFFDGAETISQRNIERVAQLGGGINLQPRMAYQGEYFLERHGAEISSRAPPIRHLLDAGLRVGLGSAGATLQSMDPWATLYWLTTGRTLGGTAIYPPEHRLDRAQALALHTHGNTWFSGEEGSKGKLDIGQLADFAVLSQDYFSIADEEIRQTEAELTVMDGRIVYAQGAFRAFDLTPPMPLPEWSPANHGGGSWRTRHRTKEADVMSSNTHNSSHASG